MYDMKWYEPSVLGKIVKVVYENRLWIEKYDIVPILEKISYYPKQKSECALILNSIFQEYT